MEVRRAVPEPDERRDWNTPPVPTSIGVILHEMLTGVVPFEGGSHSEVVAAIASKTPDGVRKWRPELSAELEAVILRCLSRDPEARPHASELAEQLLPFAPPGLEELVTRTLATRVSEEADEDFTLTTVGRVMRRAEGAEPWGRREWALAAVIGLLIVFAGIGVSAMTGRGRSPADLPASSAPSP